MSSKLQISIGDDAFKSEKPNDPLIEQVLFQDDVVLLFGSEKAGKSILAQQMAFDLTSGGMFLGKYRVPTPKNVIYFQAEGKANETVDRRLRMEKVIAVDRGRYAHFYKKFFPIDVDEYRDFMIKGIETLPWKPDVLFFDALYMGMVGDLIDNKDIRKFEANFSMILERYGLTGIILHHESKEPTDEDGIPVERGDKGTYGSVFIRSWVDHIFYLKRRGNQRVLSCETQRSGKVFGREELVLIGDASGTTQSPLLFEIKEDISQSVAAALAVMRTRESTSMDELRTFLDLSEIKVKKVIRQLVSDKAVIKLSEGVYKAK